MIDQDTDDSRNTLERRTKILALLETNGLVKVNELSKLFNVSDVTIRNDLAQIENKGFLIRTRGGAIKSQRAGIDFKLTEKAKKHSSEKQAIGKKAAELINDGDTIIIDSGTTTLELAKNLNEFENLIVITNALNIASQLVNSEKIKVIMLGGMIRQNSLSLIGPIAENNVKNYFCDKLFIGVDGIDSHYGITTPNAEEAHLNKMMIEISKEVIVLADSSKFLKRSFAFISPVSKINTVITDNNIPPDELTNLQNQGVKVIIV
jgi:DeoR family transcriptional regulator of aga operon